MKTLMEYALGTPPGIAGTVSPTVAVDAGGFLVVSIRHSALAVDVTLSPESSPAMESWSRAGFIQLDQTPGPDGVLTTRWRMEQPLDSQSTRFVRVSANLRP